jgi:hypothetical protein
MIENLHFGYNIGLEAMVFIYFHLKPKKKGFLKIVEGALEGGTSVG